MWYDTNKLKDLNGIKVIITKRKKEEKEMRRKHTGQPLDYLYRKLNTFNNETTLQEFDDLYDKASSFIPRSNYEIRDKTNLLQQINDLKVFLKEE